MEVKIFLTADYASVDSANKLNILGTFTQIHAHTTCCGDTILCYSSTRV